MKGVGSSEGCRHLGSQPRDQGSQTMGSRSAVILGIMDQAAPLLWDQGPKFVTLLESRMEIWVKKGISDRTKYLVTTLKCRHRPDGVLNVVTTTSLRPGQHARTHFGPSKLTPWLRVIAGQVLNRWSKVVLQLQGTV